MIVIEPVKVLIVNVLRVVNDVNVADVLCVVEAILEGMVVIESCDVVMVVVRVNKVVTDVVVRVVLVDDVMVVVVVVVVVVVGGTVIVMAVDPVGIVGITPPVV